jgi:hypothetical protein
VVFEDGFLLGEVLEIHALHPFPDPIEEELRGGLADAVRLGADLDIERGGGGEAKGGGVVGDGADEEPAGLLELKFAERCATPPLGEGNLGNNRAVLDDFELGDRVAREELGVEWNLQWGAGGLFEDVSG